ncbi:MAG: glycoside hydrolase family 1 protein, partial [Myxococcota bacterium]
MPISGAPLAVLIVILVLLVLAVVRTAIVIRLARKYPEPRWNWEELKDAPRFPPGFTWGVAAAAHQVEGGNDNNQWSEWEKQVDKKGRPRIRDGHVAGSACEHWTRYEEDIALMKELGVSAYRFSVEWSRIEPKEGEWNEEALEHYSKVIDACLREGIEPMVTFLHFTHPIWFDELGAFEKEENIRFFVRFCEKVFTAYSDRVKLWCTINEPEVVSLTGYLLGLFPPGAHSPRRTAVVMRNLLLAHARAYHAVKALPGGDEAQVGLVKNIFQFDPFRRWALLDWAVARLAHRFYNGAILDYLRTGVFSLRIPGLCWYRREDPEVKLSGDYMGLNYYSHMNVVVQASLTA